MTVVDSVIKIADWLNEGVCQEFKFKKPPEGLSPLNDKYKYEEAHPYAFPVFMPAMDKLPPNVKTNMPSVIVQIVDGNDDIGKGKRDITINLAISCWNPGMHSKDIYYPRMPEEPEKYKSAYDGWMDVWNFTDTILRKLESTAHIKGLQIQGNISYGPYKEQEAIFDYYPFWYAWIRFTVQTDFIRDCEDYQELL
ncbi:MAG: hypothetical protein NC231_12200 [Bacillus sp. (in: Bacteria)]|nr:hypothetical protein [Bacillus sp. (in: firmicutes)]MCM1427125.1 hypothetical protein [Eubacterium sp.]